jgi:diaminopropionate ammonia-lyase
MLKLLIYKNADSPVMIFLLKNTAKSKSNLISLFNEEETKNVIAFHKTFLNYFPTPLVSLEGFSKKLGVSKIWIKDESHRFGLKAFKVLGASYAVAKYLCEHFGLDKKDISFSLFKKPEVQKLIKEITLTTATDGNHGRGVAWTAQQLGCKCVVYMPKGTTHARLENIKLHGPDVTIIDGSYDEAVRLAETNSKKFGWLLVQDTSWDGYETIPKWITQGYLTILDEISSQLCGETPTHVFIQCGVGSLPAAVWGYYSGKNINPILTVVEPNDAACVFESAKNKKIVSLQNEMKSIMAGLSCGTPSKLAFDILNNLSDFFIKCSDDVTEKGMQILGRQEFGDARIISGESGAVTTGLIYYLLADGNYKSAAEELQLNKNSKILLISTEGDTDQENYKKIVDEKNLS